jgi:hypothetical protein
MRCERSGTSTDGRVAAVTVHSRATPMVAGNRAASAASELWAATALASPDPGAGLRHVARCAQVLHAPEPATGCRSQVKQSDAVHCVFDLVVERPTETHAFGVSGSQTNTEYWSAHRRRKQRDGRGAGGDPGGCHRRADTASGWPRDPLSVLSRVGIGEAPPTGPMRACGPAVPSIADTSRDNQIWGGESLRRPAARRIR